MWPIRKSVWRACLASCVALAAARATLAQDRPNPPERPRPAERLQRRTDPPAERPRRSDSPEGPRERVNQRFDADRPEGPGPGAFADGLIGRSLRGRFAEQPEDRAPLRPGEEQELMQFAAAHIPALHRVLDEVRDRSPQRFAQRLEETAPRLRQLQRIFERNPRLGRVIVAHAENIQKMRRAARALGEAPPDSPERRRIGQQARRFIAETVRLEGEALKVQLDQAVDQRGTDAQQRIAELESAARDLAAEPVEIRTAVEAYRAAETEVARSARRQDVAAAVYGQLDAEIDALREQLKRFRASFPEEVDRRFERLQRLALDQP